MKFFILVSCCTALASAGWIPSFGHQPIIYDGVPVDTPEVQHARAQHLAAHAEASARAGVDDHVEEHYEEHSLPEIHQDQHHYGYSIQHISLPHHHHDDHHHQEHNSVVHHPVHYHKHYSHPAYETSHHEPVIGHDGQPLDTPEVEEAKAHHFAEVHKALARLHHLHRRDLGQYSATFEDNNHGYTVHQHHEPSYGHHESFSHEIPQIGHDGRPLDTPEVEHAKALHFAAHHEALARNSLHHHQLQQTPFASYHY